MYLVIRMNNIIIQGNNLIEIIYIVLRIIDKIILYLTFIDILTILNTLFEFLIK